MAAIPDGHGSRRKKISEEFSLLRQFRGVPVGVTAPPCALRAIPQIAASFLRGAELMKS